MPASERRIVHEHLRERGGVETHSEGEEPERYLVVEPAEAEGAARWPRLQARLAVLGRLSRKARLCRLAGGVVQLWMLVFHVKHGELTVTAVEAPQCRAVFHVKHAIRLHWKGSTSRYGRHGQSEPVSWRRFSRMLASDDLARPPCVSLRTRWTCTSPIRWSRWSWSSCEGRQIADIGAARASRAAARDGASSEQGHARGEPGAQVRVHRACGGRCRGSRTPQSSARGWRSGPRDRRA